MTITELPSDVRQWLKTGRRGISSETMMAHFEGLPLEIVSMGPSHPHDNSDFMRCVRLLGAVPRYRNRLGELRELGDPWPALVDNWERFENLLHSQIHGSNADVRKAAGSGLYAAMKDIGC